jgi:hypothetical protein
MIFLSRIVTTSGPKAMCGANMFAMFLRGPYEDLLEGNVPEPLARLIERLVDPEPSTRP